MSQPFEAPTFNYPVRRQRLFRDFLTPVETRIQADDEDTPTGLRVRLPDVKKLREVVRPDIEFAQIGVQWFPVAPVEPSQEAPFMWGCDLILDVEDSAEPTRAPFFIEVRSESDLARVIAAAETGVLLVELDDGEPMRPAFIPGLTIRGDWGQELQPALTMLQWLRENGPLT